jgi:hypothetical protein
MTGLIATLLLPLAICLLTVQIRAGHREQYWVSSSEQYARHWEDLVWGNTRWSNGDETPEQGIDRLAGPHKRLAPTTKEAVR